jgi:hypothetical protein
MIRTGGRSAVLAWLIGTGLLAATGPAGADGDGRVAPLPGPRVVVDAHGVPVGTQVNAFSGPSRVWRRVGGLDVLLEVTGARIRSGSADLGFESADCTGPPWILSESTPGGSPFFTESALGPGGVLHAGPGPQQSRPIASRLALPGSDPPCVAVPVADQVVRPAVPILDLSSFEPPFRLR